MRSRISALVISLLLVLAFAACNKQQSQNQPAADNTSAQSNQMAGNAPPAGQNPSTMSNQAAQTNTMAKQAEAPPPPPPPPPPPLVVPAGTNLVVRMGHTINTKTTNAGDTFTGTLAHAVAVGDEIAIPAGSSVSGTVVSSKSPGKFKGAGDLVVSLNTVDVNGVPTSIETSSYGVSVKGKGKRTAVITGGGKGALIGGLVGGGAGAAGSAFTGNKELEIPAESAVTFKLKNEITVKRTGKKTRAGDQDSATQ